MKIAVTVTVCRQIGMETYKDFHITKIFEGESKLIDIDNWIKSIDAQSGLDSCNISIVVE